MRPRPTSDKLEKRIAVLEQQIKQYQIKGYPQEILTVLMEAFRYIPLCKTFEDAAKHIFDHCKRLIGARSGYVALLSENGEENEVLYLDAGGLPCDVDQNLPMPIRGLREITYKTKEVAYDNAFPKSAWSEYMPEGHVKLENVLFTPLIIEDKTVGVIGIANKPNGFNKKDVQIAKILGDLAAVALTYARAQVFIKESEKKYRILFENTGEPLFVAQDGRIVFQNPKSTKLSGYSAEEFRSKSFLDFIHEDDREIVIDYHLRRLKGEKLPERYAFRIIHKNGRILWAELNAVQIQWNRKPAVLCFMTDITEQKQAEAVLKKNLLTLTQPSDSIENIEFEDLFNPTEIQRLQDEFSYATSVASIITQPDGTPITTPSNFCRLCSDIVRKTEKGLANCCKSDAILGRPNPDGPTIQTCLSGGLWDAGAAISVGGRHVANWLIGQVRNEEQTEDKMRIYAREIGADEDAVVESFNEIDAMSHEQFEKVARALFTLSNQLSNIAYQNVQQARFISDRKRAEVERKKLQDQLLHAQKMESIGRLAGGVAHDFNNMLGVILGHVEFAQEKAEENHDLSDDLNEIQKAAQRSANLTKQLLTFARKDIISPKQIDLNDTVESMLNMLRRLIGEDLDLVWQPGAHIWSIKMDPIHIDQILANLCINARDSISGVGKLTIETGRKSFDEEYCKQHVGLTPGDFVLLSVSDNGCGMDKETLDNLFEPFFTTKEVGKGTGLGLATIYGIVKQNNGFINVYSDLGQGSTFNIYLPRFITDEEADNAVPEKKLAAGGTETILLVEDEPTILRMTRMMLERKGYSVLPAATPAEAVEKAKEHLGAIDLLMTDVVMPEMNGRDLAGQITEIYPDTRLLFMSGYTADVIAHQGVLDGGVAFIQKPFAMADLIIKVREVLDTAPEKIRND